MDIRQRNPIDEFEKLGQIWINDANLFQHSTRFPMVMNRENQVLAYRVAEINPSKSLQCTIKFSDPFLGVFHIIQFRQRGE